MKVLGIDPGSISTGWAIIEMKGNKASYVSSGVLKFDKKLDFLNRVSDIKKKVQSLVRSAEVSEVALESLIYVKSPTALIKLSQTRGIILSELVDKFEGRIFEYSPNLVKSTAVGHGHADKESVQKFIDMLLGKREYETHDESDAIAIALCHALNKNKLGNRSGNKKQKSGGSSLKNSLAHKIGERL